MSLFWIVSFLICFCVVPGSAFALDAQTVTNDEVSLVRRSLDPESLETDVVADWEQDAADVSQRPLFRHVVELRRHLEARIQFLSGEDKSVQLSVVHDGESVLVRSEAVREPLFFGGIRMRTPVKRPTTVLMRGTMGNDLLVTTGPNLKSMLQGVRLCSVSLGFARLEGVRSLAVEDGPFHFEKAAFAYDTAGAVTINSSGLMAEATVRLESSPNLPPALLGSDTSHSAEAKVALQAGGLGRQPRVSDSFPIGSNPVQARIRSVGIVTVPPRFERIYSRGLGVTIMRVKPEVPIPFQHGKNSLVAEPKDCLLLVWRGEDSVVEREPAGGADEAIQPEA